MRNLAAPQSGVEILPSVDVVGQWRLDETVSTDSAVDDSGRGNTLVDTGSPGVASKVYDTTTSSGGRSFNGSTQSFGLSDNGHIAELSGEATVAGWVVPRALGGTQQIYVYGGTGSAGAANNITFGVLFSADEISASWQHSTNTNVIATSSGLGLSDDEPVFFVCARERDPDNAGRYRVRADVWQFSNAYLTGENDGLLLSGVIGSNLVGTDGTTAALHYLGRDAAGSSFFEGDMTDIVCARRALSYEWGREQFFRGVAKYDRQALLAKKNGVFAIGRPRVLDPDGVWIDLNKLAERGWLVKGSVSQHIDDPIGKADLELVSSFARLDNADDSPSLAINPGMAGSALNNYTADTLIRPKTRIKLDVAIIPDNGSSTDYPREWEFGLHWDGFVADPDEARETMGVPIDGAGAIGRDMFIQTAEFYGDDASPEPIEDVVQEIFDDAKPASYNYLGGLTPIIRVETSPSKNVNQFQQEQESTLSAVRALIRETGFDFRWRFVDAIQEWVPDIAEPDRSKSTVDYTFAPEQILEWSKITYGSNDIRNAIHVTAIDGTTGERIEVTALNTSSIDKYGYLWGEINEGEAYRINSLAEITVLADGVLADMAEPKVWASCTLVGFFPAVELWDRYTFQADGRKRDADITVCVIGFTHNFGQDGSVVTSLELRGDTPAFGHTSWIEMMAGTGQSPSAPLFTLPTVETVEAFDGVGHGWFTWDAANRAVLRSFDVYEVWTGDNGSFTTSSGQLRARVRTNAFAYGGLSDPYLDVDGYMAVRVRDVWGNVSALSTPITYGARYTAEIPAFRAYASATTDVHRSTFVNGNHVGFATEDFDDGAGGHFISPVFTAKFDGTWEFYCRVEVAFTGTNDQLSTLSGLYLNSSGTYATGTQIARRLEKGANSNRDRATFQCVIKLTTGDTVRMIARDNAKATTAVVQTGTLVSWFEGRLLSG